MAEKVKSHRRVVRDETGKVRVVETEVKAENIIHGGDLPEFIQLDNTGEAMMVGVDGKMRRATLATMINWMQANIQADISFHIPYANAETGNWMVYDPATGSYQDSGVGAIGADGKDGAPGKDGGPGPAGADGADGQDGKDGKDGMACRTARFVVGTSTAGWTVDDCDYLCDGADDQAEIQAAINAMPADGGEIIILDGTYAISSEISIEKQNVRIRGCGCSTVLNGTMSAGHLISINGSNFAGGMRNCALGDFKVVANQISSWLFAGACADCEVFNTTAVGAGIYFSTSGGRIHHNNIILDGSKTGIQIYGGTEIIVSDNTVKGAWKGMDTEGSKRVTVVNNTISGCARGICSGEAGYAYFLQIIAQNLCVDNECGIVCNADQSLIEGNICIRGSGTSADYSADQYTIMITGDNCLICGNLVLGKAVAVLGTGNTVINNKDS